MSKLVDRLNSTQAPPKPIGFGRLQAAAPKPRLTLVASLPASKADQAEAKATGADAGVWRIEKSEEIEAIQEKNYLQLPWGIWLSGALGKIETGKPDFIIFSDNANLFEIEEKKKTPGYVIQVDASLSDGLIRALDCMPVDAVLVSNSGSEPLTWRQLMQLQRFAILSKPLLVTLPPEVGAADLKELWESGIDGVVVDLENTRVPMAELRRRVDLIEPPARKRGRVEALIPRIAGEPEAVEEDEEEEGE